jgi:tetratricopeptide (TPR) repeat protein
VNNISTCLAQQLPSSSSNTLTLSPAPSDFPISAPAPRSLLIDQARQWATKAITHANNISAPERTDECDVGCAVATHNLGEFLEMEGKIDEARRKYEEALGMAKKVGFADGVAGARAGIARLKGKTA